MDLWKEVRREVLTNGLSQRSGLSKVRFGVAHAEEDFDSLGAAGLSAEATSGEAEAGVKRKLG